MVILENYYFLNVVGQLWDDILLVYCRKLKGEWMSIEKDIFFEYIVFVDIKFEIIEIEIEYVNGKKILYSIIIYKGENGEKEKGGFMGGFLGGFVGGWDLLDKYMFD